MSVNIFSDELPKDFLEGLPSILIGEGDVLAGLPSAEATPSAKTRELARMVELARALTSAHAESGIAKWFPETGKYSIWETPKHKAFFDAGRDYPERLFMAANRSGKSLSGAFEVTCHATGEYPSWWNGAVFEHPTDGWAVGPDARTVRDTIQKELLGAIGEWGTGMIPASKLGKATGIQGVPGAIDTIRIKHISGGWSTLGFKNYKQDIQAFMGTSRHYVWCDEECPIEIWNECNIRTATTKGIMLATFTPLEGLTRMVINFCKKADFLAGSKPLIGLTDEEGDEAVGSFNKKAVIQAGWDDAPWLDEETKSRLLADTPPHLRDARSKGIPSLEGGNVYSTPIEQITCEPFSIPENWPRMYALDVGWNRTAAVWATLDPNSDTLYFYDEHYQGEQEPHHHAYSIRSRGEWIHGVIDPASRGRSSVDGKKLWAMYRAPALGLKLFLAKNERESGIQALSQRFATGKARVFKTLTNFQREYMLYRRKTNGQVIDEDDHLMDAARYVINNMNRMISSTQARPPMNATYRSTQYDI